MRKLEPWKGRLTFVFVFTLAIFLCGLLLGNYLTLYKFRQIDDLEYNLRTQTTGAELQYQLLVKESCGQINNTLLTEELYRISERVDYMESQRGRNDPDVLRLKNTYSLLQIRHLLFTEHLNEECDSGYVTAIYFYDDDDVCPDCKEQGYTLTHLRRQYPNLRVYSFDIRTDNPAVTTIKQLYQVTGTPSVVLPKKTLGFTTYDELDALFQSYGLEKDVTA